MVIDRDRARPGINSPSCSGARRAPRPPADGSTRRPPRRDRRPRTGTRCRRRGEVHGRDARREVGQGDTRHAWRAAGRGVASRRGHLVRHTLRGPAIDRRALHSADLDRRNRRDVRQVVVTGRSGRGDEVGGFVHRRVCLREVACLLEEERRHQPFGAGFVQRVAHERAGGEGVATLDGFRTRRRPARAHRSPCTGHRPSTRCPAATAGSCPGRTRS